VTSIQNKVTSIQDSGTVEIELPRHSWVRWGRCCIALLPCGLDGGALFAWRWTNHGVFGVCLGCVFLLHWRVK
jgi:hypothetical protein